MSGTGLRKTAQTELTGRVRLSLGPALYAVELPWLCECCEEGCRGETKRAGSQTGQMELWFWGSAVLWKRP